MPHHDDFSFLRNYGKVKRLYPTSPGTFFSLTGGETAMKPKNGYYFIATTHNNYETLIKLLYMAADRRWKLNVRTEHPLNPGGHADVVYLVRDWPE